MSIERKNVVVNINESMHNIASILCQYNDNENFENFNDAEIMGLYEILIDFENAINAYLVSEYNDNVF